MIITRSGSKWVRELPSLRLRCFSTLKLTEHESPSGGIIAHLAFDRPKQRNAISRDMNNEFHDYIKKIVTNSPDVANVRALILSSTNEGVFCAGADLKERKTFTSHDTAEFLFKLNSTLDLISDRVPIPTIAAIQGKALGGGLEIALAADFRILASTASVGLPETRLAIIPGAGGTHRLPKLVGYSKALELIASGSPVSAEEALKIGLANRVGTNADEEALQLAHQICSGGPLAIKAAKMAVRGASHSAERAAYAQVVDTEDKHEALAAFSEKRKPVFKGR